MKLYLTCNVRFYDSANDLYQGEIHLNIVDNYVGLFAPVRSLIYESLQWFNSRYLMLTSMFKLMNYINKRNKLRFTTNM